MDIFIGSLITVLQPATFGLLALGVAIGFVVGILPGLGGAVTLALLLPFVYDMDPIPAFAFLLGMHAVVATTGDITSVLFGIPGEATTVATILDGHPMAKRGEALGGVQLRQLPLRDPGDGSKPPRRVPLKQGLGVSVPEGPDHLLTV